jgi:mRNA interferase MazF
MAEPARGEVWLVDLNPVRGHEQAGIRPALIISEDLFNKGPAGLVVVIPITSVSKGIPLHVEIRPPEGGLREVSYAKCEDVRSISKKRLLRPLGRVREETIAQIEDGLKILLGLP